jgi:hypothetical protein
MEIKLKKLSAYEEIFVDIRETDVKVKDPFKGITIPIDDYIMLHSSTGYFNSGNDVTFLGLNRVFKEIRDKTKEIPEIDRKSFWLRNSELFACICSIVFPWIDEIEKKHFPDPKSAFQINSWMKMLNTKVITIEPSNNWYGFIIDLYEIKKYFTERIVRLIESLHEKGFSLNLLAENGLGNNNSANIYIQISDNSPLGKRPLANDSYFNYHSLILEKTNFKVKFGQNPNNFFKCFNKEEIFISQLRNELGQHSDDFLQAVTKFNLLFDLMTQEKLNEISYNALLLDLYDRNRNESSVDLDDRLKNLIKKTIKKGHNFSEHQFNQPYTWANLIKSIVRNNAEDIFSKVRNNPYEITQLFSKKMVIQKMERIYTAVFSRGDKEKEMKKYLQKQIDSFREIEPFIFGK